MLSDVLGGDTPVPTAVSHRHDPTRLRTLERRDRVAFAALLRVDPEQVVYASDYEEGAKDVYLITKYSDRVGRGIPLPEGAVLQSVAVLNNVTYYAHKIK